MGRGASRVVGVWLAKWGASYVLAGLIRLARIDEGWLKIIA